MLLSELPLDLVECSPSIGRPSIGSATFGGVSGVVALGVGEGELTLVPAVVVRGRGRMLVLPPVVVG